MGKSWGVYSSHKGRETWQDLNFTLINEPDIRLLLGVIRE
jgi:hypothetical protein